MSSKSDFPWRVASGLDRTLQDYLDRLGRKADAVDDLGAAPTNAQIAVAFNALLNALRDAGKMES